MKEYGNTKIILGADCKNQKVASSAWTETSELEVIPFIKNYEQKGIRYVICTDIAKDGMLQGTANELYQNIMNQSNVKLIASGGVSSIENLLQLQQLGCEGAIIGKAFYEGKISLKELQRLC